MKTWKSLITWVRAGRPPTLQWGHVNEDVEEELLGQVHRRLPLLQWATSMKTWKSFWYISDLAFTNPFNGATSMKTWKSVMVVLIGHQGVGLQWGHVNEDVEENVVGIAL